MAIKLMDNEGLVSNAFANYTENGKFIILSGKLRNEVTELRKMAKQGERSEKADAIESEHTIKVTWDFARLTFKNAAGIITTSQSPTVAIQNYLRSKLSGDQVKKIAKGETSDEINALLPGGCKVEKGRLYINVASWLDRPSAKTPADPLKKVGKALDGLTPEQLKQIEAMIAAKKA